MRWEWIEEVNSYWDKLPEELRVMIQWMADYQYAMEQLEMTKGKRQTRYWQMVDHQWAIGNWPVINVFFYRCGSDSCF